MLFFLKKQINAKYKWGQCVVSMLIISCRLCFHFQFVYFLQTNSFDDKCNIQQNLQILESRIDGFNFLLSYVSCTQQTCHYASQQILKCYLATKKKRVNLFSLAKKMTPFSVSDVIIYLLLSENRV